MLHSWEGLEPRLLAIEVSGLPFPSKKPFCREISIAFTKNVYYLA